MNPVASAFSFYLYLIINYSKLFLATFQQLHTFAT